MEVDYTEFAALRAEVEGLKAQMTQLTQVDGGGDGFGPDFGLPITPFGGDGGGAFRLEGDNITHCNFQFGRQIIHLSDVQLSGDGIYYLKVPHNSPMSASIVTQQESSDLTKTVIPLFQLSNGEIIYDYRGMPVIPVRE